MRIIRSIREFPANPSILTGFVPTMGALHEGHLSLIERSKRENDRTVVSIFVNPTQFGPGEDFSRYPRPLDKDCEMATASGADLIFAPDTTEMYGDNPAMIHVPYVTELFEGGLRPGHFDGVATIVAKLFNVVSPKNVYFGEKDLQQCAVIGKLVADFEFKINIITCETVREKSGLAKSSRNIYLSESELLVAPYLHQSLLDAKSRIIAGDSLPEITQFSIKMLQSKSFQVDYFDLVDRNTMHPINEPNDQASLIVAAKLGNTRLIDNVRVTG